MIFLPGSYPIASSWGIVAAELIAKVYNTHLRLPIVFVRPLFFFTSSERCDLSAPRTPDSLQVTQRKEEQRVENEEKEKEKEEEEEKEKGRGEEE